MIVVKFRLRKPNKTSGKSAIYVDITTDNGRYIGFPGISILIREWDKEKQKPKAGRKNTGVITAQFNAEKMYREVCEKIQQQHGTITVELLKKTIADKKYQISDKAAIKQVGISIADFFQKTIADTKSGERLSNTGMKLKSDSIKPYNSTLRSYEAFEKEMHKVYYMESINQKLLNDYDKYLTQVMKLALNTKSRYLKTFMLMLRYGVEKKVVDKSVVEGIKICLRGERSDSIFLNDSEIDDLCNIKTFKSPTHELVLQYFIIGLKTGLRWSDYSRIRPEHINNGMIQMIQKKVMERVTVPIHPIVADILAKHPNGLPKCVSNQSFNEYLKEICKPIPSLQKVFEKKITRNNEIVTEKFYKWELVQSHTCRRSFATNEYRRGTPVISIMAITGHKSDKTFMNYIKMDGMEHAEFIQEGWNKNDKSKKQ